MSINSIEKLQAPPSPTILDAYICMRFLKMQLQQKNPPPSYEKLR